MKRKLAFVLTFMFVVVLLGTQEKAYASSSKIIEVEAGHAYNIALKDDGTVWTWGDNSYGQLGDGTSTQRNYPLQVSGLSGIVAVDAGNFHSVALKNDGTVWSWGRDDNCQLGDRGYAGSYRPAQVIGLSGIVDVSCGEDFTVAVKNDETVWAWGSNMSGQLGINCYTRWSVTPVQVLNIGNVTSIKVGMDHTVALKSNGEVWTWGCNGFGQCGDGTTTDKSMPVYIMSGVTSIGAGQCNSFAVKTDGTVWAWGMDGEGQLGIGTCQSCVSHPVQMIGATNVKDITGVVYHTMVLKNDGTVWVCGSDLWGELGDGIIYNGTDNEKTTLIQLGGITGATNVSGGYSYTIVLLQDGSVWGCGINDCGQLGE